MQRTTREAARILGVKPNTIVQNIRRGNIQAQKNGSRDWFISDRELRRWQLQRRKIQVKGKGAKGNED